MYPVIVIDGDQLEELLLTIVNNPTYKLSVCLDEGGAKFKINNGVWSPAIGTQG